MTARRDGGDPAVPCPTCREKIPLVEGVGPVGRKTFTCRACGTTFRFGDDEMKPGTDD